MNSLPLKFKFVSAIDIAESIRYEELLVKTYNTAGQLITFMATRCSILFIKGYNLGKKYSCYNSKLMSNMAFALHLFDWPKALKIIEKAKNSIIKADYLKMRPLVSSTLTKPLPI
ncbi:hypothetical protein O9929_17190 [Vibrio lentus]|nr:hypothetical protein [Vibrio lentus]